MRVEGLFRNAKDTMSVPAGGVIFREGDAGTEMYGIVEGQILEISENAFPADDARQHSTPAKYNPGSSSAMPRLLRMSGNPGFRRSAVR